MQFNAFLRELTSLEKGDRVTIGDVTRTVKGMVRLTAKNYLEGEYIKVFFEEDGYLLVIPQDEEVYYSPKLQKHVTEITDEQIGRDNVIEYRGKRYVLENKDDYQFVLEVMAGGPLDAEGEARFSDYFPEDGSKEFLSLGWMSYTGERGDLHCAAIEVGEIGFDGEI